MATQKRMVRVNGDRNFVVAKATGWFDKDWVFPPMEGCTLFWSSSTLASPCEFKSGDRRFDDGKILKSVYWVRQNAEIIVPWGCRIGAEVEYRVHGELVYTVLETDISELVQLPLWKTETHTDYTVQYAGEYFIDSTGTPNGIAMYMRNRILPSIREGLKVFSEEYAGLTEAVVKRAVQAQVESILAAELGQNKRCVRVLGVGVEEV